MASRRHKSLIASTPAVTNSMTMRSSHERFANKPKIVPAFNFASESGGGVAKFGSDIINLISNSTETANNADDTSYSSRTGIRLKRICGKSIEQCL